MIPNYHLHNSCSCISNLQNKNLKYLDNIVKEFLQASTVTIWLEEIKLLWLLWKKCQSRKLKPLCHYHTSQDNFHLKQIQLLRPFSISEVSNRSWFYPNILLLPKIINQSNIVDGSRMKKDSRKFEKQFENKFLSHYQSK